MIDKFSPRYFLMVLLTLFLLLPAAGCTSEEEVYEMETDEEFQQAVENAVERFLRNDNPETILDDLYETFAERYSEEEIEEYVMEKVNEETEQVNTKLEELEQRVTEAETRANELKEKLENQADEKTLEDINEHLKPLYNWIEKLDTKIEEASDPGRIVELMEEKINTYNELSSIIEDKLDSDRLELNHNLEARDLLNYYHDIENLLEKEKDIVSAYERVSGDNFISEQVLHDELRKTVIPKTETLLDDLKGITTESEDVENLHDTFMQTWELKLEGYEKLAEAIKNNKVNLKADAEELIEEGERYREQFLNKLEELV